MKSWSFLRHGKNTSIVRGPPGSLCGLLSAHVDDQCKGGRGTIWKDATKRLRARFSSRECSYKEMIFHCPISVRVSKDIKPAKTRRNVKPDDCATHLEIRPSKEAGWRSRRGQTRAAKISLADAQPVGSPCSVVHRLEDNTLRGTVLWLTRITCRGSRTGLEERMAGTSSLPPALAPWLGSRTS